MMKTLVFFTVLAASAALAGNAVSVGTIEPPTEHNAHWRLVPGVGVGCIRNDLYIYGCNDAASMLYVGQPINLGGYDGVAIVISYSLKTADEGDYCKVTLSDGYGYKELVTFSGNTDGLTTFTATLDEYYGCRNLGIYIVWVSDEEGVAEGIRIHTINIQGVNWGEGTYNNIFTWDATEDVTGPQTLGVNDLLNHTMCCLALEYGTDGDGGGWWAVDNMDLVVNGESVLPRTDGGYGVEDFESGGWYQDRHGYPGGWEIDTDHATGGMSGANWQCDSAAHPGWQYEAETFSPWLSFISTNPVIVNLDTWFHPGGPEDYASLGYYAGGGFTLFEENFSDLYDWECYEGGEDVVTTSWGEIKAGF